MGLVIDTNFFIDVENKRLNLDRLEAFSEYGEAYIAAITVSELLVGVHLADTIEKRIKRSAFVEGIISNIPSLEFNEEVARTYAEIYAFFLKPRKKSASNVHDLQIASTALTHGFPVLTSNVDDFRKVPGIKVLSP
jgi:predicted nucleic acid-binding protein